MSVAKQIRPSSLQRDVAAAGEEAEEARRAPEGSSPAAATSRPRPVPAPVSADPEVVPKAERRKFTTGYKLGILEQAEACTVPSEVGALLRREGLYGSHLCKWRQLREQGQLHETAPKPRGRKPDPATPLYRRAKELEQENLRLRQKLRQAEAIIAVQKKVSEILDISLGLTEEPS
jgi:transposase